VIRFCDVLCGQEEMQEGAALESPIGASCNDLLPDFDVVCWLYIEQHPHHALEVSFLIIRLEIDIAPVADDVMSWGAG